MASKTLLLICLVALLRPLWGIPLLNEAETEYKGEENYVEDYPEMDQEVEDMDPGWDDEGNDEVDDDADFNDEYDNEEYDDDEQPDKEYDEERFEDEEVDELPEEMYENDYEE